MVFSSFGSSLSLSFWPAFEATFGDVALDFSAILILLSDEQSLAPNIPDLKGA